MLHAKSTLAKGGPRGVGWGQGVSERGPLGESLGQIAHGMNTHVQQVNNELWQARRCPRGQREPERFLGSRRIRCVSAARRTLATSIANNARSFCLGADSLAYSSNDRFADSTMIASRDRLVVFWATTVPLPRIAKTKTKQTRNGRWGMLHVLACLHAPPNSILTSAYSPISSLLTRITMTRMLLAASSNTPNKLPNGVRE